jgi:hypothetical protein
VALRISAHDLHARIAGTAAGDARSTRSTTTKTTPPPPLSPVRSAARRYSAIAMTSELIAWCLAVCPEEEEVRKGQWRHGEVRGIRSLADLRPRSPRQDRWYGSGGREEHQEHGDEDDPTPAAEPREVRGEEVQRDCHSERVDRLVLGRVS